MTTSSPASTAAAAPAQALRARWQALADREKSLLLLAGAVVALALMWWLALAPALATLKAAPQRHAELDRQLQRMQSLQAEAEELKAAPRNVGSDSAAALRTSLTNSLGSAASLQIVGDRATLTLKAAPADQLAPWLAQARSNARATAVEARLTRVSAANPASPIAQWNGTLVLTLPAPR